MFSAALSAKSSKPGDKETAVIKIQCAARARMATNRVKKRAKLTWQRVFDPAFKMYFWYNKINGQSIWTLPRFVDRYSDKDIAAAALINRICRSFVGRMRARHVAHTKYTRFFDFNLNRFYWMENKTEKTSWKASLWLVRQEIPMPPEDMQLYTAKQKIRELEAQLGKKEKEIKEVRKLRFDELEPKILEDRVKNAKALVRSKHLDEWNTDELAAWFTELKMEEYIPFLYANRVDGHLFINLSDDDWTDMGIVNRFHVRKLQLILKSFRIRYQRKKEKIEYDEDDELLSEYAPSELSDMIHAEGQVQKESSSESSESSYESEEEEIVLTAEQIVEKELDEKNIIIEVLVPGDGVNFPMIGDIVRIRYVCYLVSTNKILTSSKNGMQRASVEFVLGIGQVIKGFDRAIPQMTIGERSKVTVSPEYAYKAEGLFPFIPPNAFLRFDLTILGFRPRAIWVKPLIQVPGLSEKPYWDSKRKQQGFKLPFGKTAAKDHNDDDDDDA